MLRSHCLRRRNIHVYLIAFVDRETDAQTLTQGIKCLATLVEHTPYDRMARGHLARLCHVLAPLLLATDNTDVRVAVLTAFGAMFRVAKVHPNDTDLLFPRRSSGALLFPQKSSDALVDVVGADAGAAGVEIGSLVDASAGIVGIPHSDLATLVLRVAGDETQSLGIKVEALQALSSLFDTHGDALPAEVYAHAVHLVPYKAVHGAV